MPRLTDDDVEGLRALVARARREGRVRDYAYTSTLLEINRFLAARTPNRAMRQTTTVVIARLAYILPEPPTFRQWQVEDFLQLIEEAAEARDPETASEACHALALHFDAHVVDVHARYGTMES
jgi:DNA-binding GntR family transcriptional regulator